MRHIHWSKILPSKSSATKNVVWHLKYNYMRVRGKYEYASLRFNHIALLSRTFKCEYTDTAYLMTTISFFMWAYICTFSTQKSL